MSGKTVTLSVREALREAMADEIKRDPKVFLIGKLIILFFFSIKYWFIIFNN